ncbi:MAG: ABC transporter ATP-binding protein [Polyangiaceae bacterium]|nr:ABC transporter ATP-binding protein [Polyangiaceae bacterium]
MANDNLVEVQKLQKRFGSTRALSGIDLELGSGQVIGLLGPNGAGKTTLLRHFIGLLIPTEGSVRTFGKPAHELGDAELARIGFVDAEGDLLDWLTVDEHIAYVAAFYERYDWDYTHAYIQRFELPREKRVRDLSTGMRQRLAVLLASGHRPDLLLLDEPAAAMDPLARAEFLDLMMELIQDTARTIVISSHILSDIERVVDRVLIMKQGEVIRDAELDTLREEYLDVEWRGPDPQGLLPGNVVAHTRAGEQSRLVVCNASESAVIEAAARGNAQARVVPVKFEDIYRYELGRQR